MGLLIVKHAASKARADIRDLVIVTYDPTLGKGRGLWSYNSEV